MTPGDIVSAIFGTGWRYVRGFTGGTSVNSDGHHGWDLAAKLGTPLPALAGGTVVYAENAGGGGAGYVSAYRPPDDAAKASKFWTTGGGNTVVIEAADGTRYHYAHLSAISVKVGDKVSVGSLLGQIGQTGDATGAHLHFAMESTKAVAGPHYSTARVGVAWVDPSTFLTSLAANPNLSAFNFLVSFPVGHKLTENDINMIVDKMNAAGWFQGTNIFGEVKARNAVADVLKTFVGREWSPALLGEMASAIGVKSGTVDANPVADLASLAGKLFDPMTYIHVGALLIGVVLAFKGFQMIASSGGTTETVG